MKRTVFAVALMTITTFASAVELKQASNAQLLEELNARLSGDAAPVGALASYSCAFNGAMTINLTAGASNQSKTVQTGDYNPCMQQMAALIENKTQIASLTSVGICAYNGALVRYTLKPDGQMESNTVQTGTYDQCLAQAKLING